MRANIDAASKALVDFLASRFVNDSVILPDKNAGEKHVLYTKEGKLKLSIQGQQSRDVTFLTNEDEKSLVDAVFAALPIYNGEVEEV